MPHVPQTFLGDTSERNPGREVNLLPPSAQVVSCLNPTSLETRLVRERVRVRVHKHLVVLPCRRAVSVQYCASVCVCSYANHVSVFVHVHVWTTHARRARVPLLHARAVVVAGGER